VLRGLWLREAAVKSIAKQKLPENPDDVTDAARLRVYGVLAPKGDKESTNFSGMREASSSVSVSALDRVHTAPGSGPRRLFRSRLSLKSYRGFSFVIPPHAIRPRVEGTFKTLTTGNGRNFLPVDVMLLNPEEFSDLIHQDGEGTASFATGGSDGAVDWSLAPTFFAPQKYYLVFRNPSGTPAELVDVDFSISFD
jgi:hypothetical protein